MKGKIKAYLMNLDLSKLGLALDSEILTITSLGLGESNLNYLVKMSEKSFLVRINVEPSLPKKSLWEFEVLKLLEPLRVAPRAYHCEMNSEEVGAPFIIIEFFDGEDLTNEKLTASRIRQLARLVAQIHNIDVPTEKQEHFRKFEAHPAVLWESLGRRVDYLAKKWKKHEINNRVTYYIHETAERLKNSELDFEPILRLGHGDIAPQNVLVRNSQLQLIDWEAAGLMDPAQDLAILYDSFDLLMEQQELFMEVYTRKIEDVQIRRRIKALWPWQVFGAFLWSLMHAFEIKDNELHKEFVRYQDLGDHISYSEKMFEKCKVAGIFPEDLNWAAEKVFPKLSTRNKSEPWRNY
ncbi:MAG: aminoglycoside phosphotransferase family protein [Candidatus Hodarchaeota archaeon]